MLVLGEIDVFGVSEVWPGGVFINAVNKPISEFNRCFNIFNVLYIKLQLRS